MSKHVAVDLGADSGRVIVGDVGNIEEVHRFRNGPVRIGESIFWSFLGLFTEIKRGLKAAFERYGDDIISIGMDTWGVDYGLLDKDGDLIGNPYHYRDKRTDGIPEELFGIVPFSEIYRETGIQMMQINTIYQLFAHIKQKPGLLNEARTVLTVPSLLSYWLTGVMKNEYTHASTTQLYNMVDRCWSGLLAEKVGFDRSILAEVVPSETKLGPLLPHVAREVGAGHDVTVIASASHDTASAVAAVPASESSDYAYLSSGTWSLLGVESEEPVINDKSLDFNFTNEGAADGGIRLLKNIMGLWILQESKRHWESEGYNESYDDLSTSAEESGDPVFEMDVDDARFLKPGVLEDSMPARIEQYCRDTKQKVPGTRAEVVRGIYDGLARKYTANIRGIEEITGRKIDTLHVVGGGSSDDYLCRLTAEAAKIPVYAGPKEATAIGNILVQAVAMGEIDSIETGRRIIRESYDITEYKS